MSDIEIIRSKVSEDELLCQLAEEATELAKAALKLRRAKGTKNPTPVTPEEAYANLIEELGDIELCLYALNYDRGEAIDRILARDKKLKRWVKRLGGRNG